MTDEQLKEILSKRIIRFPEDEEYPYTGTVAMNNESITRNVLSAMREAMRLEVIAFEEWRLKMNSFEFSDAELYFSKIRNTEEQYNYYLNHMK